MLVQYNYNIYDPKNQDPLATPLVAPLGIDIYVDVFTQVEWHDNFTINHSDK